MTRLQYGSLYKPLTILDDQHSALVNIKGTNLSIFLEKLKLLLPIYIRGPTAANPIVG